MLNRNELYETLGQEIVAEQFPWLAEFSIAWIESDSKKTNGDMPVFGECKKVSKDYSWCCPYDYMIVIYPENCAYFSEKQLKILLEHELRHIGKNGKLIPHDVGDFRAIISKYGDNWADEGAQ